MPLVVLAAAGVITVWATRQKEHERREVHDFVVALSDDLRRGRDPSGHLRGTDQALTPLLISRLQEVTTLSGGVAARLEIETITGDTDAVGQVPAPATHIAMFRVDGVDVLGLRVVHRGGTGDIVIIGFWIP